jgi:hypothetical protein
MGAYKYYFKDSVDTIKNEVLTKDNFNKFVVELKMLNINYNYSIFLMGGYLAYLTEQLDNYSDIDFFITNKHAIDLDELTSFLRAFHLLAKKYNFAYDLLYFIDASESDINLNPNQQHVLNIDSRVLKLYKKKSLGDSNNTGNHNLIGDTELFEGLFTSKSITNRFLKKSQTIRYFHKPLKIS